MIDFSVVLPAHNEEKLLPYSFPSIIKLEPSEIVLLLDRCTDNTKRVAVDIAKKYNYSNLRTFSFVSVDSSWKSRIAFLRYAGSKLASYDHIVFTACDLVLDYNKIKDFLKPLSGSLQLISFWHNDYPFNVHSKLKSLFISLRLRGLGKHRFMGGVHFFNRNVAFMLEDVGELKSIDSAEDTHLLLAISSKFHTKCVNTGSIHLRPRDSGRDYLMGRLSWSVGGRGLFTVVVKAMCLLQPLQIKGYIHERFGTARRVK